MVITLLHMCQGLSGHTVIPYATCLSKFSTVYIRNIRSYLIMDILIFLKHSEEREISLLPSIISYQVIDAFIKSRLVALFHTIPSIRSMTYLFTYCDKTKVMFNTLTSMINPKYNMIATIWYFITNILLLWNEVESWIVSNRIPHYQVTKYCCHPHLRSRKCAGHFFAGRSCWSNCTRLASPACRQRHRSCVVWNLTFCHTLSFSAKCRVVHHSLLAQVGMSSCANYKCEIANVNIEIASDFRVVKCVTVESWSIS